MKKLVIEGGITICYDQRGDEYSVNVNDDDLVDMIAKWAEKEGFCQSCWHPPLTVRRAIITFELLDED